MTTVHATVKFASVTGMPKDSTQVGFTFWNVSDTAAALVTAVEPLIESFFNDTVSGSGGIAANFLGGQVARTGNAATVTYYDLTPLVPADPHETNPHLGPPIASHAFTPAALSGTTTPLPSEVAVALSYHGALTGLAETVPGGPTGPKGDTHPRARHRGRIYIGPLNSRAISDPGTGIPEVDTTFRTLLTHQAGVLMASGAWCVWSRTDHRTYPVIGGYVDDAPDTQRRRGELATGRTTFGTA